MKRDLGPSDRVHHLAERAHIPDDDAGRRVLITVGCMIALCLGSIAMSFIGAARWHAIPGALLLASGIVELADAVTARATRRAVRVGLAGAIPALAGLVLLFALGITERATAQTIGVFFIVNAVFRGAVAFFDKYANWKFDLGYAAVTVVLGALVLIGWPDASMTMVGYFMAIEFAARAIAIGERDVAFRRAALRATATSAREPLRGDSVR